ncbi:hypothetical protein PRIPAC_84588 [Pristionchus pacificus]|uniref:Major sperm protein n=1 Tax=Pristionchus pacificus TaxID=54126 RepID=A0A2A6C4Z8_PRIPA|nr:hypothetical protein PRIPAC_84588 [Pristionchus pacificus]|eukprot:PDM73187.1 MSP domain-containing protein [Pristionchus pacificus]
MSKYWSYSFILVVCSHKERLSSIMAEKGEKSKVKSEMNSHKSVRDEQKGAAETPDVKADGGGGTQEVKKEDKRLSVDPEEGHFLETGGKQEFMLVNTMDTPVAVKIKCSNNAQYKVMPVYLSIDKSQISTLTVTRSPGPAKNDKLVAAYCPMVDGVKDPKEAITKYETTGKKCQIIRIMLKVVNAEDFAVPDPSREAVS